MNMEIPDMKMISDFEARITCLQNPTLFSRFFSDSGIENVSRVCSFWKWGAALMILSLVKTTIVPRFLRKKKRKIFKLFRFQINSKLIEILAVKGRQNGTLRYRRQRSCGGERFAWSEYTSGKNVVKLWDSLGLGLNFVDGNDKINSKSVVSIWNFDNEEKNSNSFGWSWNIPALAMASPAVVLTAERNGKRDGVVLGAYDTRMPRTFPAIYADWGPTTSASAPAVDVSAGGVEKVYVRNGVSGALTVGDMRKLKTPIENLMESDSETWWDAGAVIVDDELELVDESS
ncbi:hypothetical protein Adt_03558 [Abeliophyllum distichum]|uniref:Uncharacterized protein n=1 Tax=Abeliophyllum distichum TaxID=126358 RepID=A0ABD1VYT5_9LAMI